MQLIKLDGKIFRLRKQCHTSTGNTVTQKEKPCLVSGPRLHLALQLGVYL